MTKARLIRSCKMQCSREGWCFMEASISLENTTSCCWHKHDYDDDAAQTTTWHFVQTLSEFETGLRYTSTA